MAKMLDAGEAIFAEGGDGALTVEAVVKRAGTSVGSFYSRFGDRDGLLQSMHERFLLRIGGAAHVAVAAAGNEKTLARRSRRTKTPTRRSAIWSSGWGSSSASSSRKADGVSGPSAGSAAA